LEQFEMVSSHNTTQDRYLEDRAKCKKQQQLPNGDRREPRESTKQKRQSSKREQRSRFNEQKQKGVRGPETQIVGSGGQGSIQQNHVMWHGGRIKIRSPIQLSQHMAKKISKRNLSRARSIKTHKRLRQPYRVGKEASGWTAPSKRESPCSFF